MEGREGRKEGVEERNKKCKEIKTFCLKISTKSSETDKVKQITAVGCDAGVSVSTLGK